RGGRRRWGGGLMVTSELTHCPRQSIAHTWRFEYRTPMHQERSRLLAALPARDYELMLAYLETVELPAQHVLAWAGAADRVRVLPAGWARLCPGVDGKWQIRRGRGRG